LRYGHEDNDKHFLKVFLLKEKGFERRHSMKVLCGWVMLGFLGAQVGWAQESPSGAMAANVVSAPEHREVWKDEGALLDGLAAEWHTTADGQDFHFIQATVDRSLARGRGEAESLEDVGMASSVLLVYRVTQQPKYYEAARALHGQLTTQGKMEGLDRYRSETFRAAYAATFQQQKDFAGIAERLLVRETDATRMRGEYAMALVDVLDWIPTDAPQRRELVTALRRTTAAVVKSQDAKTGLWHGNAGNDAEASANCALVYAMAKGVRMGYLSQMYEVYARRGWEAIQNKFGKATLADRKDGRAVGTFLLAGSEMEQSATEARGQGKTALVDAWFNSQTRKNAAGQTELFHYKWDDDSNNGFSFFGRAFQRYGVKLVEERMAPTTADLKKAQIYILASPDIPSKNPNPHFMDAKSVNVIADWVRAGGVLLLMENDGPNSEFEHFNILSERFGIHFNAVIRNHVVGEDYAAGALVIPAGTGVFERSHRAYMKDTSTISVKAPAKAALVDRDDVMIAVAKYGKGTVFAVVDPWVYNEYTDRRNDLPVEYDNFDAAIDLAGWAVRQSLLR
jgi:unsaturated rhamnogalacturonyl hydrolase